MGEESIAFVSEALRALLATAMLEEPPLLESREHVVLASPADMPHDRHPRLGIFLYQVNEEALLRVEAGKEQRPLTVSLCYLVAPVGPDSLRCQKILARVLRTLYGRGRIRVPQTGDELELLLHQRSFEEQTRLWLALDTPYACALYYDVRSVPLT